VKRWKRDLGIVRELGPDTPAFDEAVARVWTRLEEIEADRDKALAALRDIEVCHDETARKMARAPERVQPWNRPDWPERSGL